MWRMALLLLVLLASCRAAVTTDFDRDTDFGRYRSYDYYPDIASGLNDLDNNRVKRALDSLLGQRGLSRTAESDLLINFYVEEFLRNSRSTIGVSVGGGRGNVGVGIGGGVPVGGRSVEQTFTVDLIDRLTDRLIWQARAEASLPERATSAQKTRHYFQLMERIVKVFPIGNVRD